MAEPLGELTRTHTCGALRPGDVGANVVLLGAMLASGLALSRESILVALPEVLESASPEALAKNERALDAGREAASGT